MLVYRYILRAHVGPFLFSLCTLMFLFLLQFVMKFIDQLVGKGLSAWVIMELVTLNLSWMLVLAVPMSVLVAILMAFGDLSSRNEITALKASGVSIYRMMAPVLLAGFLIGGFLVWFNNYVLPESNHRLKALTIDIRRKRPTLSLVDGVFSQEIPGYSILVKQASQKTNDLTGVTIYDYTNPATNVVITARRGRISFSSDFRKLIMDLQDGEIHQLDLGDRAAYRRVEFETHRIAMPVEGFDFERTSASAFSRGDRELGAGEMLVIVDSLARARAALEKDSRTAMQRNADIALGVPLDSARSIPPPAPAGNSAANALLRAQSMKAQVATTMFQIQMLSKQIDQYWVEIHKKFSIPTACIVFVLVGVPLGIMSRRGGFGTAATLSLGFFVLYWACLIGGEKLADRDIVSPLVGMWSANVLISVFGVYLTVRSAKETILINWGFLWRIVPKRWRPVLREDGGSVAATS
jgi:lipopolysaccharide export system permease protein